jgi:putative alpha-1,2-mannosidase
MARSPLISLASLATLLFSSISPTNAQNSTNILDFVDPLIGTINGGHVFAGASLPFSMAKAVADTNGGELQGGYASDDSNITGFSHMHDSGTGGVSRLFILLSSCPMGWFVRYSRHVEVRCANQEL